MKIKKKLSWLLLIIFFYFLLQIFLYNIKNHELQYKIGTSMNYSELFQTLIPKLLIYEAKVENKELDFAKMSLKPIWIPFYAFKKADVFISYSEMQDFDHYAIAHIEWLLGKTVYCSYNPKPFSDNYIPHDFFYRMENLKAQNKKIILQLNLLRLDSRFLEVVWNDYQDMIICLNLIVDVSNNTQLAKCKELLDKISEKLVLVSRNTSLMSYDKKKIESPYYIGNIYDSKLFLTYINKKLVDEYSISLQQNTEKIFVGKKVRYYKTLINPPKSDIHWVVTVTEIVKQKFKQWTKQ